MTFRPNDVIITSRNNAYTQICYCFLHICTHLSDNNSYCNGHEWRSPDQTSAIGCSISNRLVNMGLSSLILNNFKLILHRVKLNNRHHIGQIAQFSYASPQSCLGDTENCSSFAPLSLMLNFIRYWRLAIFLRTIYSQGIKLGSRLFFFWQIQIPLKIQQVSLPVY